MTKFRRLAEIYRRLAGLEDFKTSLTQNKGIARSVEIEIGTSNIKIFFHIDDDMIIELLKRENAKLYKELDEVKNG